MILFFEALFGLLAYDLLNAVVPFRIIMTFVKGCQVTRGPLVDGIVGSVLAAVNHACVLYPKRALCLQRAFVTTWLLRRKSVHAFMVLGAQQLPFKAHAWVEVDGQPVNERSNVQTIYAVWQRC